MAVIWTAGFDDFDTTLLQANSVWYTWPNGYLPFITSGGQYGGNCLAIDDLYGYAYRPIPGNPVTVIYQFGFKLGNYGLIGDEKIFAVNDGATVQCYLTHNGAGILRALNGSGTLLGAGSTTNLLLNTWHDIEAKITIHPSAGVFTVKVDNVQVLTANLSQVTRTSANSYTNLLIMGNASQHNGAYWRYDNMILMNTDQVDGKDYCNDFLGPKRLVTRLPTGNGSHHAWTPSTGTNYQTVDEVPPSTTDYNTANAIGDKDTFTFAPLTGSPVINAVVCNIYGGPSSAMAGRLKSTCVSGVSSADGTEVVIPGSVNYLPSIIYEDPATVAPFTVSGLNAAEFGYKWSG